MTRSATARPTIRRGGGVGGGVVAMLACLASDPGCTNIPRGADDKNDLSAMAAVSIEITDRTTYTAYVADAPAAQQLGLMNVTEEELPADHGMVFVFDRDALRAFWMRNTIIPLDIAYIRSDGTIVKTHTMEPLTEFGYPSVDPARFVLEVRGGEFARWEIVEGDHVTIPAELFDP